MDDISAEGDSALARHLLSKTHQEAQRHQALQRQTDDGEHKTGGCAAGCGGVRVVRGGDSMIHAP